MDSTESYPVAEYEIKVDSRVILYENQGGVFLYQNFMHIFVITDLFPGRIQKIDQS
jgi:hypothetical protein